MADVENAALARTSVDDGARRAAAVVLALGPEVSEEVLRHLDERQMRALAHGARELRAQPPTAMTSALRMYVESMGGFGTDLVAGDGLLRDLLEKALGVEAAERVFADVEPPAEPDALVAPLLGADAQELALVLGGERPHTAALLLGALPAEKAAAVHRVLPPSLRARVIEQMARLESVPLDVLEDLVAAVLEQLEKLGQARGRRSLAGFDAAVSLLRRTKESEQKQALDAIGERDPELAARFKARVFVVEDIVRMLDRDVQVLLKEIDPTVLTLALKSASSELKKKLLSNMSQRMGQMLLEDMELLGPVRLADVEKAREGIAELAAQLANDGKITIIGGEEELL